MPSDINYFPRVPICHLPTPLMELRRLSKTLDGPKILMKRDDLTGLALGGNKTRKLEYLLGQALSQRCDTVITGGALQSNHCRQTAAASAAVGLECHLALGGNQPDCPQGNFLLDCLLGATIHWCGEFRKGERIPGIAAQLAGEGRKPYIIPYGGSNTTGALGFVAAIAEVKQQLAQQGNRVDCIVIPSSSGGTHVGMTVGLDVHGLRTRILGIGIDPGSPGLPPYESELAGLANGTAAQLGVERRYRPDDFHMTYDYCGEGYGIVGGREREAISLLARYEGILLDPVYSGRAMGALIDLLRRKEFTSNETVLFWHTGGTPAIFAYGSELCN